jgi:putative membrane protein insertion efficiency factor
VTWTALPLVALVRIYQWTVRPVIGCNCRYHPGCSDYAIEALATHGTRRGTLLAVGRVLRCNPWSAGGWDPVPPAGMSRTGSKGHAAH